MRFAINGQNLTLPLLEEIAVRRKKVRLADTAQKSMDKSLLLLKKWIRQHQVIYGINTGFGGLSDKKIPASQLKKLQLNIIRSHSSSVGPLLSASETRAIMLLRAQSLARGYSGVRPALVKTLLVLLNKNILPVIPSKGSVGASGDLSPLAHLGLLVIGEGEAFYRNRRMSAKKALRLARVRPLQLAGREGIALVNGTQMMTAISALNILKARRLSRLFDVAAALSLEAMRGSQKPFDADIHRLRPHPGQKIVAQNIWKLVTHSAIQKNHRSCGKIQDAYSYRCVPQVHGSSRDIFSFVENIVETELNSVTDNPLLFADKSKWLSGGNFHGQYLSHAMDLLGIAMATLVNISERRIEKLLDPKWSDLPAFLIKNPGLFSGLMGPHYTAAALASENKVLAHPASVDTIPTSNNKEDHVSMGPHAALKAKEIIQNAESVLAIELLAASQGIALLRPLKTSTHLETVVKIIRKKVRPITRDRVFAKDIESIKTLLPDITAALDGTVR